MLQDGRDLLSAAAISGNEELVHMLVEDYTLAPGFSTVNTKCVLSQRDVPDAGANFVHCSMYVVGTANSVLNREVSFYSVSFIKRFHSIAYCVQCHHLHNADMKLCQVLDCLRRYVLLCAPLHVQNTNALYVYLIVVGWEEYLTQGSSKWECILV